MYARIVTAHPLPGKAEEAMRLLETEVIPILNSCKGFRGAHWMASGETETVAISLWDSQEDAEAYQREHSAEVMALMSSVIEGPPQIRTYDVLYSTGGRTASAGA